MHWLLVVIVAGAPVKTDLIFNDLSACLVAESDMRKEWAKVVNTTTAWANQSVDRADLRRQIIDYATKQITSGTCIPSK